MGIFWGVVALGGRRRRRPLLPLLPRFPRLPRLPRLLPGDR